MKTHIRKFIHYFIPHEARTDEAMLSKYKLFTSSSFITAFFALCYGVMSVFIGFQAGIGAMAFAVIYFSLIPFLLKRHVFMGLLSNTAIAVIGIIYVFLTYYSGGITAGPMDHWLLLLPMLGMLLLNLRQALIWLCIAIIISAIFFYYESQGVVLPVAYPVNNFNIFNILSFIGIILILFLITNVFESGKNYALKNLDEKNKELSEAFKTLRQTQTQLIQHEKLAALGQMATGIAHEIQNPINFIHNFSQLSIDLLNDLRNENDEEDRKLMMNDLAMNLEKICEHSKRADFIVKSMMDHNQLGKGEKRLTDINWLGEEFLRMSYNLIHSQAPDFNCTLMRELDNRIPKIMIVPQEFSRVLLNLFNNAFYAVKEKYDQHVLKLNGQSNYQPSVELKTQLIHSPQNTSVAITVRDNGTGIPDDVFDKIFQPFFTTKPGGKATGLGLSMSYDIVKSHGGEITVDSKSNEYTQFVITLPAATTQ